MPCSQEAQVRITPGVCPFSPQKKTALIPVSVTNNWASGPLEKQYQVMKWCGFKVERKAVLRPPVPLAYSPGHQITPSTSTVLKGGDSNNSSLSWWRWKLICTGWGWIQKATLCKEFLNHCILLSPWRRQNLRRHCRSLLKSPVLSLQEALHIRITF